MEHRYGQRSGVMVAASIHRGGRPTGFGYITNFSSSGLFIRTRCDGLRPCQNLEILCTLGDGSVPERIRVGVVRTTDRGVAVAMEEHDRAALEVACRLREHARHAARGAGAAAEPQRRPASLERLSA